MIDRLIGAQLHGQAPTALGQTLNGLLDRLMTASGRSLKSRQGIGEVQPEERNNGILMKALTQASP